LGFGAPLFSDDNKVGIDVTVAINVQTS